PDGQMLVSSSGDQTIKLWDVQTGECLNTLSAEKPYAGMNITGARGLSEAQQAALRSLGAVEGDAPDDNELSIDHGTLRRAPIHQEQYSSSPHNLPAQLTSFIGRDQEIATIRHVLESARLVTLTGAGGCGKTRLALQVAAAFADDYADGVCL